MNYQQSTIGYITIKNEMTLQDFFTLLGDNPSYLLFFFIMLPIVALLAGFMKGDDAGHLPPWSYLYSSLIYLACVPGVFAVTLSIYFFLFERRSILQTDVYTQILPVVSMLATLFIIRKSVNLSYISGFEKMGGLIMMISAALGMMWFIDRTRIFAFIHVPFQAVIVIFVVLLVVIRVGWTQMFK
jgi:hypothetical protein